MNPKDKKHSPHSESISLTDLAKKIVLTSLGSAAMARDVVKDSKKQKEVFVGLLSKAERTKDELMEILAREVTKFLGKISVADEITKALKGLVINLNASVDFKEKKGQKGVHPTTTIHSADISKENNDEI